MIEDERRRGRVFQLQENATSIFKDKPTSYKTTLCLTRKHHAHTLLLTLSTKYLVTTIKDDQIYTCLEKHRYELTQGNPVFILQSFLNTRAAISS